MKEGIPEKGVRQGGPSSFHQRLTAVDVDSRVNEISTFLGRWENAARATAHWIEIRFLRVRLLLRCMGITSVRCEDGHSGRDSAR